jgi:hypothetical protein
MTIDPQRGIIDWTPPPGSEGTVPVVVRAANRIGEDRLDFSLKVRPAGLDREPPSRVPTPEVNRATHRGTMLTWLPAIDNVEVAGYRVFAQAAGRGNSLFQAADVAAPVTSHEVTTLAPGTQYRIWVVAYDRAGNTGAISGVRPLLLRTLRQEPRPPEP